MYNFNHDGTEKGDRTVERRESSSEKNTGEDAKMKGYSCPFQHHTSSQAKINLAKSNPELSAKNKAEADRKREKRKEAGSTKAFK
jgi:hypothetical protein